MPKWKVPDARDCFFKPSSSPCTYHSRFGIATWSVLSVARCASYFFVWEPRGWLRNSLINYLETFDFPFSASALVVVRFNITAIITSDEPKARLCQAPSGCCGAHFVTVNKKENTLWQRVVWGCEQGCYTLKSLKNLHRGVHFWTPVESVLRRQRACQKDRLGEREGERAGEKMRGCGGVSNRGTDFSEGWGAVFI